MGQALIITLAYDFLFHHDVFHSTDAAAVAEHEKFGGDSDAEVLLTRSESLRSQRLCVWLFNAEAGPASHVPMIWKFLERRRVRRIFRKVVDPETVESLLRDGIKRQPLRQGRIEFVVAFVRGESPSQISERTASVADIATTHGVMVHGLIGALVVLAFGTHSASTVKSGNRSSLVDDLREHLARDIKMVHGAADGHHGLFGSEKRMEYSFWIPNFDVILGTLSRLEFGQVEEFRE